MRFDDIDARLEIEFAKQAREGKEASNALPMHKYGNPERFVKLKGESVQHMELDQIDRLFETYGDYMRRHSFEKCSGGGDIYDLNESKIARSVEAVVDSLTPEARQAIRIKLRLTKDGERLSASRIAQLPPGDQELYARVWRVSKESLTFRVTYEGAKEQARPLLKSRGLL